MIEKREMNLNYRLSEKFFLPPDENLGDKPGAPNDCVLAINTWKTISIGFLYISLCKG